MKNFMLGKFSNRKLSVVILLASLVFCGACGDSTSNNQGVSFTFLGWFQDATGATGASGFISPLSSTAAEAGGENTEVLGFVGMQNHLDGQTIRVQRLHHDYFIPGSKINIPSTVVALGTILSPSTPGGTVTGTTTGATTGGATTGGATTGGATTGGATTGIAGTSSSSTKSPNFNSDSSLPSSSFNGQSIKYAQLPVVTTAIRSFLNLNRNDLPELPFVMVVRSYVIGTTSAGRAIVSNDNEVEVVFTEDVPIAPTDGTDTTTGGLTDGSLTEGEFVG